MSAATGILRFVSIAFSPRPTQRVCGRTVDPRPAMAIAVERLPDYQWGALGFRLPYRADHTGGVKQFTL